uniref:Col_cuticle_N domain-containing protein n=1 Tax=Strongyloides papillosus TaxID=174720 RepID=A0A0N5BE06_STREA
MIYYQNMVRMKDTDSQLYVLFIAISVILSISLFYILKFFKCQNRIEDMNFTKDNSSKDFYHVIYDM